MRDKAFVYEGVAERIENMITDGALQPGEKVPSLRKLSRKMGVSITSVMRAYGILEHQGFIEALPQSGYYVKRRSKARFPEPAVTMAKPVETLVAKNQLIASFLQVIKQPAHQRFGCATPDPALLPNERLDRRLAALCRKPGDGRFYDYDFPPGDEGLRKILAQRAPDYHCRFTPDDVLITNGCLAALNLCLNAVAKPGDTIAIESPTYFGVLQAIENHGMRALEIPTHPRDGVDLDQLEPVLAKGVVKACLFVTNFNNPLGSCMPDANKRRLAEMLAQYETPLIEDDVYGDLYFGATRPRPVKAFDRTGRVLLCSSVSKTMGPGLRIGWVVSERYKEVLRNLQFMTTIAAPTICQRLVAEYLRKGDYENHVKQLRKIFRSNVDRFTDTICATFPSGTGVTQPKGGFFLWLSLPENVDAVALYRKVLAQNISFAPGPLFTPSTNYQNHMRITCSYPWSPQLTEQLAKIGEQAVAMAG